MCRETGGHPATESVDDQDMIYLEIISAKSNGFLGIKKNRVSS